MYCVCLVNLLRTSSENSDSLFSPKTMLIWELCPALDEASTVQVWRRWYLGHRKVISLSWNDISLSVHDIPLIYIYIWLKRYIFKRKRLFVWSSTIQRFMAAVRKIALQLCRRPIIPTETFSNIAHISGLSQQSAILLFAFFAQYCNVTKRWRLNWVTSWVVFMIEWSWNYSGFIWTSLFLMAERDATATRDY